MTAEVAPPAGRQAIGRILPPVVTGQEVVLLAVIAVLWVLLGLFTPSFLSLGSIGPLLVTAPDRGVGPTRVGTRLVADARLRRVLVRRERKCATACGTLALGSHPPCCWTRSTTRTRATGTSPEKFTTAGPATFCSTRLSPSCGREYRGPGREGGL